MKLTAATASPSASLAHVYALARIHYAAKRVVANMEQNMILYPGT